MVAQPHYAYEQSVLANAMGARQPNLAPVHGFHHAQVVGTYDHEQAERLMGKYLTCSGIHLPPDPSPRSLTGDAKRFWEQARREANEEYHDDKLAQKTAWKALRLFFRSEGRQYIWRPAMPRPGHGPITHIGQTGDLVYLGPCVEFTYIGGDALLHFCRFEDGFPAPLYWSDPYKCLYVFPGLDAFAAPCEAPDRWSSEATMFQRWAQRPPQCARDISTPDTNVQLFGNMDTLVYRSDKWHDPNDDQRTMNGSQEYIHQFGDGVGTWPGPTYGQTHVPAAIVITGGCLDVEERGIIH